MILPPDWPDLPEVRLDYARYLAEVRDLDHGIGQIDQLMTERGIKERTLVIFMGDNGESLLRGKGTLYTRGINVPLILRWPGKVPAGSHSDALISGVDLARISQCAVKGVGFQWVRIPPGNWSLQPEAIEAAEEVTSLSEPLIERVALGDLASM